MKTNFILLGTTVMFALLATTFGYQSLLHNYQYWICWESCVWESFEDCEEICKDTKSENGVELPREERREYSQKLREMYNPVFEEHRESIGVLGGLFPYGSGYSHPASLSDNLDANFEYSDVFFTHFQKLDIVSPLNSSENAGKITVVEEMLFPELWMFWAFIVGSGIIIGKKIRR